VHNLTYIYFSLEQLGIIQLGDNISSKQTKSAYPSDLTANTNNLIRQSKEDVFKKFAVFHNGVFDSFVSMKD
jgi:hypothetical protein